MKKELLKVDNSTIYEVDHNMLSLEIEGHEPIHAHYTSESVIEDLKQISGCLQRIDNFKKSEKIVKFIQESEK